MSHTNDLKRRFDTRDKHKNGIETNPPKKAKLLDDSDQDDLDLEDGGTSLKVNAEYARRFEYNKKREEKQRLEEKYRERSGHQDGGDNSDDSEEGVEEDDNAELLDEALDDEVNATLQALRSKDPRIYDLDARFYAEVEASRGGRKQEGDTSMTLRQYHTKNLLEGILAGDEDIAMPKTYNQEQEEARSDLVKELQAANSEDEGDFLVAKPKAVALKTDRFAITKEDVVKADQDPETFLSNFMASRAWIPTGIARYQPLESDDEDEEAAAEEWENSYNMYFEENNANEKIMTYSRDTVASNSVRRDDMKGRRKAREAAKMKREGEKKGKELDLARLRRLKVEDVEQKVKQIRKMGGLHNKDFKIDEWKDILEKDWSDDQWDAQMRKRFGDAYYEDGDAGSDSGDGEPSKRERKAKKPKFDDDIDIEDLVPAFRDDEDERPETTLSSDEDYLGDGAEESETKATASAKKPSKKRKHERAEAKSIARRDRRLIENLVEQNLELDAVLASKSQATSKFRYRDTSPVAFGLTARDILLADDKQLNEFAGLKKLAAFRDPVKKKKDKKFLSKKARLRHWRQETFGDSEGPKGGFGTMTGSSAQAEPLENHESNVVECDVKKKKKRNRKRKSEVIAV